MADKRFIELMEKAADEFDNCSSPFIHEWLVKNNVTADECYNLSKGISAAITSLLVPLKLTHRK